MLIIVLSITLLRYGPVHRRTPGEGKRAHSAIQRQNRQGEVHSAVLVNRFASLPSYDDRLELQHVRDIHDRS